MAIISALLYGLLGVFLSLAGVSVIDKPIHFLSILAVVLIIDLVGRIDR
jgi:hypothetical protein